MITDLFDNLVKYVESRIELTKFEIKETITETVINVAQGLILGILALMFTLFLSVALAQVLNEAMESRSAGFFIVAGFYLVLSIIAFMLKDSDWLKDKLMTAMFKKDKKNPDQDNKAST